MSGRTGVSECASWRRTTDACVCGTKREPPLWTWNSSRTSSECVQDALVVSSRVCLLERRRSRISYARTELWLLTSDITTIFYRIIRSLSCIRMQVDNCLPSTVLLGTKLAYTATFCCKAVIIFYNGLISLPKKVCTLCCSALQEQLTLISQYVYMFFKLYIFHILS